MKVHCETATDELKTLEPWKFKISYDKLVIALGAEALTFGIHGVKENAIFLREVHHAQEIRRKLLLNLMLSDIPGKLWCSASFIFLKNCVIRDFNTNCTFWLVWRQGYQKKKNADYYIVLL